MSQSKFNPLYYVVGTPIAQVKSPSMVSEVLQQRSFNTVCIPAHVAPAQLAALFAGIKTQQNVDGIMVTVPHKISFTDLCDSVSEHAQFLHTVNVSSPQCQWHLARRYVCGRYRGAPTIDRVDRNRTPTRLSHVHRFGYVCQRARFDDRFSIEKPSIAKINLIKYEKLII
ncbi:hypothetical protein [Kingella kingae]|uniref:hypothetical protein n=1 Tax=Kingella kingae TaxID=504 RepID=UPI001E32A156|nr:hypothetical protein [Kingella kingae]